jgi:lipopolysaccharide/colanic/teichoic acid biosynthesis glycosyltransferase
MYEIYVKRFFDISFSSFVLVFLLPFLFVIWTVLLISNRGKAFFLQERVGKDNKIFKVVKFKTMNDRKGNDGKLLPDAMRLTAFGSFVRSASIDEIPQLINVIKGDMSLIGPRPLLVRYLPLYDAFQIRRHHVLPGITGWAQVNGRNAITWQEKFNYDVWYVENLSLALDARIFVLTFLKVFKREGISADGVSTMPPFTGNK